MIDREALLADLQKLLDRVEADLLERSESADVPDVGRKLRAEYERAKTAERTAQNFEDWRTDWITQHGAAWLLSCVFVRFLEDNRLIEPARIAGPAGERLQRARDEHELYFRDHPRETDREYLLAVFDELASLPGTKDVFGPHNPVRELPNWLSGDAATELLRFFQKVDANTGLLVHDFTDPPSSDRAGWDTRFLGDLYQDLSEAARKKYALLQTPEFVEEFILDRTLDPALDEFGLEQELAPDSQKSLPGMGDRSRLRRGFRMIDPACGSGHFLLGAFPRLLDRWQKREPGTRVRELVQRALDSIYGVDINPYAVAIARFRLLLAAMRASGITQLADAPAFHLNIVCGDSLLHAPLRHGGDTSVTPLFEHHDVPECSHAYAAEDLPLLKKYLAEGQYHAVVANPPYITPKDRALNQAYRDRYDSCHMKYSLAVPFLERIYRLAADGGYTGQITANSFMKREFGKKLIEEFLPKIDLTHVIDTSLAYIPHHGTPTVILLGCMRSPVTSTIRCAGGIRRENEEPTEPSRGLVWSAISAHIDLPGSHSAFISVSDLPRELFQKHPWSIGGGGASELKERLENSNSQSLGQVCDEIGVLGMTNADEIMLAPESAFRRASVESCAIRRLVLGDAVREWSICDGTSALFPYRDDSLIEIVELPHAERWLWPSRTVLGSRATFARLTYFQEGRPWWEWHQVALRRLRTPLSFVFAFVATHNQFVLDRGSNVFNRTAPIVKLPTGTPEDDHLAILGLLNSSIACFWMKQTFYDRGGGGIGGGIAAEAWERFYEHDGTKLKQFPLPDGRPLSYARILDNLAAIHGDLLPDRLVRMGLPTRLALDAARRDAANALGRMISTQEELDWECYQLYGLIDEDLLCDTDVLPQIRVGERAFEIVLARTLARGEVQTMWFERHGSTPITEVPTHWPAEYQRLVERRIEIIESNPQIALIEQPEYKRRWNTESWESQQERALREWLLDRLESYFDFDGRMRPDPTSGERTGGQAAPITLNFGGPDIVVSFDAARPLADIRLVSVIWLADVARQDADFLQVGEVYRNDPAFDVQKLIAELVESESVPLLPVLRYKASGLRKRAEWEQTWELQRQEDAIDARPQLPPSDPRHLPPDAAADLKCEQVGTIPVPPKYTSADFLKSDYWRLRGKLDVPKERWVSFPHCEGPDGTLVIAWAGYNHLQLARAISEYYVEVQERHGGRDDPRLIPLLACLIELLPWLKQWHNAPDPEFDNMRMGDYFESFVNEEARQLGRTIPEIKAWEPPERPRARGRRKG